MPSKPMTVCAEVGCPTLTRGARCDEHQPADTRPSAHRRGYGRSHRRRRARYLKLHPTCECPGCHRCTNPQLGSCTRPSEHLDHVDGNVHHNPDANYAALCASCHAVKTAKHDGSFGRQPNRRRDDRDDEPPSLPVFA